MIFVRKLFAFFLCVALFLSGCASAEVYVGVEKPADWSSRELMTLTVFPAFQNDCMLLECGGQTMLIDGGVRKWNKQLRAVLEARDLLSPDIYYNSHPHDDHTMAVQTLLKAGDFRPAVYISPFSEEYRNKIHQATLKILKQQDIPFRQVADEEVLFLGAEGSLRAEMTVHVCPIGNDPNERSGMLHIRYGEATLLLTADIAGVVENWYVKNYPMEKLKADIMKVPHHGLNMFVSDFLDGVAPKFVFFTTTRHATKKQMSQLTKHGVSYLHNSMGKIIMETDGQDWYVEQVEGW